MDINTVLGKWDHAKKQKAFHEKECSRYKDAVERYMNKKEKETISGTNYIVTRRSTTRQSLSKNNVPLDIWNTYSSRFTYKSYYLKEK
jgi:hypothetical protein